MAEYRYQGTPGRRDRGFRGHGHIISWSLVPPVLSVLGCATQLITMQRRNESPDSERMSKLDQRSHHARDRTADILEDETTLAKEDTPGWHILSRNLRHPRSHLKQSLLI